MSLGLKKLFTDVFNPEAGETVLILTDEPHGELQDSYLWKERRQMAQEWVDAFADLSNEIKLKVLPLETYPATGVHGANLPEYLNNVMSEATLILALTEYSATAALDNFVLDRDGVRGASMPGVNKSMEETALAADYSEVSKRCRILEKHLVPAIGAEVVFSTGHKCYFDLRFRVVEVDDGYAPRYSDGLKIINLPSGETYQVPYEGEKDGIPSKTEGEIPVKWVMGEPSSYGKDTYILKVKNNKIVEINGDGAELEKWREYFNVDEARRNVAEFGLGCNTWAAITGNILEDEKAGFHWAYGRSEHLQGCVSPADFKSPENIVHNDVIYTKESPIQIDNIVFYYEDGSEKQIIKDKEYIVF